MNDLVCFATEHPIIALLIIWVLCGTLVRVVAVLRAPHVFGDRA